MNLTYTDTIVKLMRRRKLAIVGSIIFFIATITFFAYSIFTTVSMTESNGIGGTIKYKSPLILANFTLYFGTYIILLTCSTLLFVYTKYSLSKTIQLYLEKPIRDISINEFRVKFARNKGLLYLIVPPIPSLSVIATVVKIE